MSENNKPGRKGIQRLIWATRYSYLGIKAAWKHEEAFRQEILLAAALFPLAFWLGQTPLEVIALITPLFILVIVELLNSAVEAVVDRIGVEKHELSGQAKDMGSAAVFFSLLLLSITWAIVACHRFI